MQAVETKKQVFTANAKYAFARGFKGLHDDNKIAVKIEIMKVFGIVSDSAWLRRLHGKVTPNVEQMTQVELVFKKFGIAKANVWGL